MAENIVLSKSDLLRVIDSIVFESEFPDPDLEDIAQAQFSLLIIEKSVAQSICLLNMGQFAPKPCRTQVGQPYMQMSDRCHTTVRQ